MASRPGFHSLLHAGAARAAPGSLAVWKRQKWGGSIMVLFRHRAQDLPGYQVPAGVAGDHNGVQVFVI